MNKNHLLGICLPTCYPKRSMTHIFSEKSLSNMEIIAPYSTFLINFQPSWTQSDIDEAVKVIKSHNFEVLYTYNDYKFAPKRICMTRVRDDSAQLLDCDYYVLIDDDMRFNSPTKSKPKSGGYQYLEALHYLITHEKCGAVIMRNKPLSWAHGIKDKEVPFGWIHPMPYVSHYSLSYGIFTKSMKGICDKGKLYPNDSLDAYGSGEDKLIVGYILNQGYYPARSSFTNIFDTPIDGEVSHTCFGTSDGIEYYIKNFLNEDYIGYLGSNLVKDSVYLEKGGVVYSEENVQKYGADYNNITYDQIIQDIEDYISKH